MEGCVILFSADFVWETQVQTQKILSLLYTLSQKASLNDCPIMAMDNPTITTRLCPIVS